MIGRGFKAWRSLLAHRGSDVFGWDSLNSGCEGSVGRARACAAVLATVVSFN